MAAYRRVWTGEPRKLATGDWELRWRLYPADGKALDRRRPFTGKMRAMAHAKKLHEAQGHALDPKTGLRWGWAGEEPVLLDAEPVTVVDTGDTVWNLVCDWRAATWRGMSGHGRRSGAKPLREMVRQLVRDPSVPVPPGAAVYLSVVAFRQAQEPTYDEFIAMFPNDVVPAHREKAWTPVDEVWEGRLWLERESLPVSAITRRALRDLIDSFARGPAGRQNTPATEARYWATVRSVLLWGSSEAEVGEVPRVAPGLTAGIKPRSVPKPSFDAEGAVPTYEELWAHAWACALTAGPRWCALPLVMGGAGLRIGEAAALRRRDVSDAPGGGLWLRVRHNLAAPGKSWTDTGEWTELRGTKGKGPQGNVKGRITHLGPAEAAVLRTHMDLFTGASPDAPVFTSNRGRPIRHNHVANFVWEPALALAFPAPSRLEAFTSHGCRHLAATRWLRAGIPISTVARWGGWEDKSTLIDFYESVMPNDDESAAQIMAAKAAPTLRAA